MCIRDRIISLLRKGKEPFITLIEEGHYYSWEERERELIIEYKALYPLKNHSIGGLGNISGVSPSPETIKKRADKIRGKARPQWVRDKISKSHLKLERKTSEENKEKYRNLYGKSVDQLTMDGVFIQTFRSLEKAAQAVNGDPSTISNVCKKKVKKSGKYTRRILSHKGYKWRWHK